jgi:hypothetical protein
MTYAEWIESLAIFAKYSPEGLNGKEWAICEHDEMWMGPNPDIVSDEDKARLEELRWSASDTGNFHRFTN